MRCWADRRGELARRRGMMTAGGRRHRSRARVTVTEHSARVAALAAEHGACGVVVVDRERVLLEVGDVSAVVNCRSIRKSLLSAVFGRAVIAGKVELDATLVGLGIDDAVQPSLSARERAARVRDLLTCRSGVYHPANHAGGPAAFVSLPPRGSRRAGEWFFYNNWDFNALGSILDRGLGRSLFAEFAETIAGPVAMQDFDVSKQRYASQPYSEHPTYSFQISTRDLARFGQLYLSSGRWNEHELIPARWIAESTTVQTITSKGPGYGYLWWVAHDGRLFEGTRMPDGAFAAYGMGGQFLVVIPALDRAIAMLADPERPQQASKYSPAHRQRLARLVHDATDGAVPLSGTTIGATNCKRHLH